MRALEINEYLNGLVPDLKEKTVDRVIYGDSDLEVEGIAVAWMPYKKAIEEAHESGANVLVTHEPTFYDHWDLEGKGPEFEESEAKMKFIDDLKMTVIRCHDVWDALPEIGIPYAWGEFLELGDPTGGQLYYNLYSIEPQSAMEFTRYVAEKTVGLGQDTVGFYGDPEREIRTVGLGTGCISNPFKIYELGADLAISVDDVVRAWVAGEWCQDQGNPLIVVNHCVSEEPGMVTLASHLAEAFPDIPVNHLPQTCTFQAVRA